MKKAFLHSPISTSLDYHKISLEFSQLFGENFTHLQVSKTSMLHNKKIVDREYLIVLILSGKPEDFARAVNLPFDNFAKQFYGEVLKIFYHYYDSCFEIEHFPVNFPHLVEYIFQRNSAVSIKETHECTLVI